MNLITVVLISYILIFLVCKIMKKHSLIDIFWGISFAIQVTYMFIKNSDKNVYDILIFLVVFLWAMRLSIHLYKRNISKPEDYRYINIVNKLDDKYKKIPLYIKEFIYIYFVQACLSMLIASSFTVYFFMNQEDNMINFLVGISIFLVGFYFEIVGDYQLDKFKKTRPKKVLDYGLWKYSRHPNYFGEVIIWYGIFIMCITSKVSLLTLVSPFLINYLIVYVSGIPLLEQHMMEKKEYREYARYTNKLIPSFKKENNE